MDKPIVLLWLPLIAVIVGEHFVLTRFYNKRSSLQRIFAFGSGAKADVLACLFYYGAWTPLRPILALLTVPGILYVSLTWLVGYVGWAGLFSGMMPKNPILIFVVWLVAIDFAVYVSHVMMHKVPWLWHMHQLHHSATEMNIVTGSRISIAENFLNDIAVVFVVTIVLGLPAPQVILAVMFVRRLVDLVQHSDLPWSYGILDYVVASPRFHRLHHSCESDDFDANYGNIFSFWDYLFGTVAPRYRHSPQVADQCTLGLASAGGTANVNDRWYCVLFSATVLEYLWAWAGPEAWAGAWAWVRARTS